VHAAHTVIGIVVAGWLVKHAVRHDVKLKPPKRGD
jgi:hypothetical protein